MVVHTFNLSTKEAKQVDLCNKMGVPVEWEREDKARRPGRKPAYFKQLEGPEITTGSAL